MNASRGAIGLVFAALIFLPAAAALGQSNPEVRRAQPPDEPPVARAVPFDQPTTAPPARPRRSNPDTTPPTDANVEPSSENSPNEAEPADRRQLEYANGLFARKLYDLAVPEYEKFLGQFPGASGRAGAFFYLGECYRALNRGAAARTSFQSVLDNHGDSEFAGPAAYGVAEILFTQKDYAGALALFHRAAVKAKESALTLSARYFEARCLENVDRKDEAQNLYQQVAEAKNPNPYRDDARLAVGSIALARGRKADALRNYEALANEAQKPALKAEATVRAGMVAVDLQQPEKGKPDKAMAEKAVNLLQKGRSLPDAGRWRGVAEVGLLRQQYQAGEYEKLLAEYKRGLDQVPDESRAEMMLMAGNSHRQLGHTKDADEIYRQIVAKYPGRDEAKDAQYQRLINIYNSNAPSLIAELDDYIKTNPPPERSDQAKLLKAEYFYKQKDFAQAAPIYAELRASHLSPKLRAEAAYKLGWCYVQLKDSAQIIESFAYFLNAFPESPQVPSVLTQRALAYQEAKNYAAAVGDLDALLTSFPAAREREAALQQKALILGQQENSKGMADTFRQLLKEFPKSAAAAQANYFIGKAAFDSRDYKAAIPSLEAARQLNKDQYYNLATIRIISALFYLKDRTALTSEVDKFLATNGNTQIPAEILEWMGIEYFNERNYSAAAKYLAVLGKSESLGTAKPEFWFYLAETQSKLRNFPEAESAYEKYLQVATDPAAKAKTLLALGATKIAAHKPDDAQKIAEEIMSLQPEGRVNAEARLLAGDVQLERQHFDDAGKAYMGVALLYEDPAITPRALEKASIAYQKAGKKEDADRVTKQLREKYPNYVGG